LANIAARLGSGSVGRTEADIQSDVRKFLLDAPLDLQGEDLLDVVLEAQAGGDRRIDVEAGCAAIEVKKSTATLARQPLRAPRKQPSSPRSADDGSSPAAWAFSRSGA
jgi:hypothetical protein